MCSDKEKPEGVFTWVGGIGIPRFNHSELSCESSLLSSHCNGYLAYLSGYLFQGQLAACSKKPGPKGIERDGDQGLCDEIRINIAIRSKSLKGWGCGSFHWKVLPE